MGYTKELGETAVRYLIDRVKHELPHFERKQGATFYEKDFATLLSRGRECHKCAYTRHVQWFGAQLHTRIEQGSHEIVILQQERERFQAMAYTYLLYISRESKLDLSNHGIEHVLACGPRCGVRTEDMLTLLRALADDLLLVHKEVHTGQKRFRFRYRIAS
jgi:hypothetical protein